MIITHKPSSPTLITLNQLLFKKNLTLKLPRIIEQHWDALPTSYLLSLFCSVNKSQQKEGGISKRSISCIKSLKDKNRDQKDLFTHFMLQDFVFIKNLEREMFRSFRVSCKLDFSKRSFPNCSSHFIFNNSSLPIHFPNHGFRSSTNIFHSQSEITIKQKY